MLKNYCEVSLSREKDGTLLSGKKSVLAFWKAHKACRCSRDVLASALQWISHTDSSLVAQELHSSLNYGSERPWEKRWIPWGLPQRCPYTDVHLDTDRGDKGTQKILWFVKGAESLSQHSSQCHPAVGSCRTMLKWGILQQGFVLGLKWHLPSKLRDKSKDQHFHSD